MLPQYLFGIALYLPLLGISLPALAAPYTPVSDAAVLEQLPWSARSTVGDDIRLLQEGLAQRPADATLAGALARRYIELARKTSDPRYLGYAQAALAPWWEQVQPPAAIQLLRATLRQSNHEFEAALADLAVLLQHNPYDAQARLTRAAIWQVRGDYLQAKRDCAYLSSALLAAACLAPVLSVNGEADRAYTLLQPHVTTSSEPWLTGLLAEIALRRGALQVAERHFRQALATTAPDAYLLAAYSDFLLDQKRPHEVIELLRDQQRADGLLLRLALAQQQVDPAQAARHIDTLRTRFAAAHARGDDRHLREEGRFTLALLQEPHTALTLALHNWKVQRETADARLVLEAAQAANQPAAAQPVLDWLTQTKLDDPWITPLAQQLRDTRR